MRSARPPPTPSTAATSPWRTHERDPDALSDSARSVYAGLTIPDSVVPSASIALGAARTGQRGGAPRPAPRAASASSWGAARPRPEEAVPASSGTPEEARPSASAGLGMASANEPEASQLKRRLQSVEVQLGAARADAAEAGEERDREHARTSSVLRDKAEVEAALDGTRQELARQRAQAEEAHGEAGALREQVVLEQARWQQAQHEVSEANAYAADLQKEGEVMAATISHMQKLLDAERVRGTNVARDQAAAALLHQTTRRRELEAEVESLRHDRGRPKPAPPPLPAPVAQLTATAREEAAAASAGWVLRQQEAAAERGLCLAEEKLLRSALGSWRTIAAGITRERFREEKDSLEEQVKQLEGAAAASVRSHTGPVSLQAMSVPSEAGSWQSRQGSGERDNWQGLREMIDRALSSGDAALARAVWGGAEGEEFTDAEVEQCEGRLAVLAEYVNELDRVEARAAAHQVVVVTKQGGGGDGDLNSEDGFEVRDEEDGLGPISENAPISEDSESETESDSGEEEEDAGGGHGGSGENYEGLRDRIDDAIHCGDARRVQDLLEEANAAKAAGQLPAYCDGPLQGLRMYAHTLELDEDVSAQE